jgi:hypothetical protein
VIGAQTDDGCSRMSGNMATLKRKLWCSCLFVALLVGADVVRAQTASLSDLDSLRYIASHGDLIEAFGADAAKGRSHYEQYGLKEGRKITFDPLQYTASHPDLIEAFGSDATKATTHYIRFGSNRILEQEGRCCFTRGRSTHG